MITVSRDALSSDRADTAEYKLKQNQIFFLAAEKVAAMCGETKSFFPYHSSLQFNIVQETQGSPPPKKM